MCDSVRTTCLHNVGFGMIHKLGSVLHHRENGSLDVDNPDGVLLLGANRFHSTILPGEGQWSLLQLLHVDLREKVNLLFRFS